MLWREAPQREVVALARLFHTKGEDPDHCDQCCALWSACHRITTLEEHLVATGNKLLTVSPYELEKRNLFLELEYAQHQLRVAHQAMQLLVYALDQMKERYALNPTSR